MQASLTFQSQHRMMDSESKKTKQGIRGTLSSDELALLGYDCYNATDTATYVSSPVFTSEFDSAAAACTAAFFDSPDFEDFYLENSPSPSGSCKSKTINHASTDDEKWHSFCATSHQQPASNLDFGSAFSSSFGFDEIDIASCLDQAQYEINWNCSPGLSNCNSPNSPDSTDVSSPASYNLAAYNATPDTASMLDAAHMSQPRVHLVPDHRQFSVEHMLDSHFTVGQLVEMGAVERLMNDRCGSKSLQELIRGRGSRVASGNYDRQQIINMLIHHLVDNKVNLALASQHMYGNYLIQSFFEFGDEHQKCMLLDYFVCRSVGWLSKSKFGCRVVQKVLSCLHSSELLRRVVRSFAQQSADSMRESLSCSNCHHVMKAILNLGLPLSEVKFIQRELNTNLVVYCEHVAACRVAQSFIDNYGDALDVQSLFRNNNHIRLCYLKYGNYVIQHFIEHDKSFSDLQSVTQFRNRVVRDVFAKKHVLDMSHDKFGSNVIETCARVATSAQLNKLIDVLLVRHAFFLKQLISHRFGNYVPSTLLKNCNPAQCQRLVLAVDRYIERLDVPQRRPSRYVNGNSNSSRFIADCRQNFKVKASLSRR